MTMGIHPQELRLQVIRPVLEELHQPSPVIENLLLGTAAQASHLGSQLKPSGALGLYGIAREVHQIVWDRYLSLHPDTAARVRGFASQREFAVAPEFELMTNLAYSTAIAWAVYASHHAIYPADPDDIMGLAHCWLQYFPHGGRTVSPQDFITNYNTLIGHS